MPSGTKKPYAIINNEGKRLFHFHSRPEAVDHLRKMGDGKNRGLRIINKSVVCKENNTGPLPTIILLEKKMFFNQHNGVYIIEDQDNNKQITSDKELAFEIYCEKGNNQC